MKPRPTARHYFPFTGRLGMKSLKSVIAKLKSVLSDILIKKLDELKINQGLIPGELRIDKPPGT
jgi:hypothetical protein